MKALKIIVPLLILLAVVIGVYQFQRGEKTLSPRDASFALTSQELLYQFESDEAAATKKYLDQILLVSGVVDKVEVQAESSILHLQSDNPLSAVTCEFSDPQALKNLQNGDRVQFVARCSGYLIGAVFVSGVLIE